MALRHVRAAQKNTKLDDPIARSVIQVIATDIGHDDSPAYPSYRTIAERAGCHYNTVAEKVKALCDNGDLIVTKKGKYNYYSLPYDCGNYHTNAGDKDGPIITSQTVTKEELSQELSQLEARLSQRLSQQVEELSQRLSHIVTSQSVTEVEVKGSKGKGGSRPAPTLDLADHPAVKAYVEVTETWPGEEKLPFLVRALGENPNRSALEKAWMFWVASDYRRLNTVGVVEWYEKIVSDPDWTPGSRFNGSPRASPNGHQDPRAAEQPESDPMNWKPVDEYGAAF